MANILKTKSLALVCWNLLWLSGTSFSQNTSCPGSLGPNVFPNGDLCSGTENVLPNYPGIASGYPATHWHGDFRGMPAQPGVYVWMAEIEYIDGRVGLLKGDVVLIK